MLPKLSKMIVFWMCVASVSTLSPANAAQESSSKLPIILQFQQTIGIKDLDWNFDSALLALADVDEGVSVVNVETGKIDLHLNQTQGEVLVGRRIAWSSIQNYLFIASNLSKLWNYDENALVAGFEFPSAISEDYTPVGNVDWHPMEDRFAIVLMECEEGNADRPGERVEIWNITDSSFFQIAGCLWTDSDIVKWNPQGTQLAISGFATFDHEGFVEDEQIEIWDVDTQERMLTISGLKDPSGLTWSPNGDMIAFTTVIRINRFIQVRSATSGEIVSQAEAVLGVYAPLEWHPSEYLIATGGQDGSVKIWNALAGSELIELPVHEDSGYDSVSDVGWSPDGSMLASVGRDGKLFIWDVSSLLQQPQ